MSSELASQLTVRDLVRVSRDRSGREKSPDDQHLDHVRTAERMGWTLLDPTYRDLGSASSFATKERAGFERLLSDLEKDTFGASVLMLWEPSRGSRQESEWLRLIELAAASGVSFWVEVRGRLLDPRNPYDRRDLVHAAADAAFETGLLSERTRRGVASAAAQGLPHGKVTYGYQRRYDERTRRLLAQEEHPVEAPLIRELFKRLDEGHSFHAIAADWAGRDVQGRAGKPFLAQGLRTLALNHAYVGLRVHAPNRKPGSHTLPADAVYSPASWPALIDRAVFDRVQKLLNDRGRNSHRPGAQRWLVSGLGVCRVCGGSTCARKGRPGPDGTRPNWYRCRPSGCASVSQPELDELIGSIAVSYLADPKNYDALTQPGTANAAELRQIDEQLAELARDLDELLTERDAGRIKPASAARGEAAFEERREGLERKRSELVSSGDLAGLIDPGPDVAARWKAAPFDVRRATLRVLLRPEHVGQLWLIPTGRGRGPGTPTSERVHFHRGEECRSGPCA